MHLGVAALPSRRLLAPALRVALLDARRGNRKQGLHILYDRGRADHAAARAVEEICHVGLLPSLPRERNRLRVSRRVTRS